MKKKSSPNWGNFWQTSWEANPTTEATLQDLNMNSGAYVFYEDRNPLYVGIVGPHSKQNIRKRVQQHRSSNPKQTPLASRMTIERFELDRATTRAQLAEQYRAEFAVCRELVREMKIRAVEIQCCTILAVFEIYAAVNLGTPYNDFCTH